MFKSNQLLILDILILTLICCLSSNECYGETGFTENEIKCILSKITQKELNRTIALSKSIYDMLKTREKILSYAEIQIKPGTIEDVLFSTSFPENEAVEILKDSLVSISSSEQISYEFCNFEFKNCINVLNQLKLQKTSLNNLCKKIDLKCDVVDIYSKYRSFDGTCNNIKENSRGKSFTVYKRLMPPNYSDSIKEIRRSVKKNSLNSPRLISSKLNFNFKFETKLNLLFSYWGEFIQNDLIHIPMRKMIHSNNTIDCCSENGKVNNPRYLHPFCEPIHVPYDDKYYKSKEITCLSYVRSIPFINSNCSLSFLEQINQATHFLDGSQIYGTTIEKSKKIREYKNGMLKICNNYEQIETFSNDYCMNSSDDGVKLNEYTFLNILWMKEHNRIAKKLGEINKNWDDEMIFHETRRIVIAEIQHVTYNEWLPHILGKVIEDDYEPNCDVSISNSFATAALPAIQFIGTKQSDILNNEAEYIENKPRSYRFEEMTNKHFNERITQLFGKVRDKIVAYDMLSFAIQRGRDHGLPTYQQFRNYCNLKEQKSFDDLAEIMLPETIEFLKHAYLDINDIDLIIGGLLEKPENGIYGPTLKCILEDQFKRLKKCDRYFFDNNEQPLPFSESQLNTIKQIKLSRIFCDNQDIKITPKNIFEVCHRNNPKIECDSDELSKLDLDLWNEERYFYFHE